ncbi:hypothetical protein JK628_03000 [Shewanella sp. KX20019]|uniref:phage tail tube protein n=1 Tax=Shewanella sp. KX20019 TaxID=2803864 RepID=UPI0019280A67|nr:phage tail tube protein [Shewanella sp. KX20019]QQX80858.1 hypothetical protein JK628_03000 [Shewanella sp. KX20019]
MALGLGTKFMRSDDGTDYTAIGALTQISGISQTRGVIDVTNYDSKGYREKLPGLRDGGQVTLSCVYDAAATEQAKLQVDFEGDASIYYSIRLPDAAHTEFKFKGFITSLGLETPIDGQITRSITLDISGPVTKGVFVPVS